MTRKFRPYVVKLDYAKPSEKPPKIDWLEVAMTFILMALLLIGILFFTVVFTPEEELSLERPTTVEELSMYDHYTSARDMW